METEVASNLPELAQLSGNVAGEGIPPQIKAVKHGAGLGIVVVAFFAARKVPTEAPELGWNFSSHRISVSIIGGHLEAVLELDPIADFSRQRSNEAIPRELYFRLQTRQLTKLRCRSTDRRHGDESEL